MGHSRGGLTTKIHALSDADGRPIRLLLTPGQTGDAPAASRLLEDHLARGVTRIADRAYDTNASRELRARRLGEHPAALDPQGSSSFSTWVCRQRNLVARE